MSIQGTPYEARPSSQADADRSGSRSAFVLPDYLTEATPAERGSKGSAAPVRFSYRTHSLMDLEGEREPSLHQLLRERDAWPELYTPLTAVLEQNVRSLVRERNGQ